jgi:hypothetical protein
VPLVLTSQLVISSDEDQLILMQGRQGGGHPASSPTSPEPILTLRQVSYTTAAEIRHGRRKRPNPREIGRDCRYIAVQRNDIYLASKQFRLMQGAPLLCIEMLDVRRNAFWARKQSGLSVHIPLARIAI